MAVISCIIIGNEPLAAECGKQALDAGHRIVAVVTSRADIAEWARSSGVVVLDGMQALQDSEIQADWLFSIANLYMVPPDVLARARTGAINFHDGPLPRYAGLNAPVWAILNGETSHGIAWHLMEAGVDTGDLVVTRDVPVSGSDTALTLNAKCFAAGVESFSEVLAQIEAGLPGRRAQDTSQRSYYGRSHRPAGAGQVDFSQSTDALCQLVRGLDHGNYDNPVASAWFGTSSGPVRVTGAKPEAGSGAVGQVLRAEAQTLVVATEDGAVALTGLTDMLGASIKPNVIARLGELLPAAQSDATLQAALTAVVPSEPFWRARLSDYRPAVWTSTSSGGEGREALPIDIPENIDDDTLCAAFAAVVAATAEFRPVDLALGTGAGSSIVSDWVPVRFDASQRWSWAMARFRTEIATARDKGPFAADLPARIAGLDERQKPFAGLSDGCRIEGAALTLVSDANGVRLEADLALISSSEARHLAGRLAHLLAELPGLTGDEPVSALPLLPAAEVETVVHAFNRTSAEVPDGLCIHQAFEAQAASTPDATALVFEDRSLSYAELDARANRLAHVLKGAGVTPGQPVGLHLRRSLDLVVAALGILKAGGAYVPLDPGYPADRIAFYVADSGARIIVSETALDGTLAPEGVERLLIDTDPRLAEAPETVPESGVTSEDLAYLIYTSGSTGTPKGVMIEHRNVKNFFAGMDDRIDHPAGSVLLSVTSLSFDISVLELFWTLARGFKVVVLGDEKLVADGGASVSSHGGMDFSLFYWGNDDGVGRDKYGLLLEGAKFADENGFQAVWTPERHFHAFGGLYPNPSVTGAAVAAVTRNIAVRAGSCVAPLHHPARIAEEWAVIDNLTNGRTGLALASGWHPDDFVLRPENAPPNNKPAVFDAVRDLRKLWAGEPLEMTRADGSTVEKVTQPRPVSKDLPLWMTTAGNPESWRQAGEHGINVLTHLLGQTIDEVAEKIGIYHEALCASGRDPKDFSVTLMLHTYIADTRDEAREIARQPMKDYLNAAADLIKHYAWAFPAFKKPQGVTTPRELDLESLSEEELDAILEFAFLRYFETSGLFGTIDDALERVAQVQAIGVTEVACLVDFGIERQVILDGLTHLAEVRARANAGADNRDYSIAGQILRHEVTHLQCTPYMARMLVENEDSRLALGRIRNLMIGGEVLPASLVRDLRGSTRAAIENMYGPTETTIWSSTGPASGRDRILSVGRPIANTQFYVLDAKGAPVGIGQPGELWIGGAGVARGYWNRKALTDEKFRDNPFHGGRMFATGDMARWRPDGTLDFLGRRDNQIKVRGYRIEIGEIEAAMEAVAGVTQAVAVVRTDASGVGQIQGYLTGSASEEVVRAGLSRTLPEFMVPKRIIHLERFPLTPNRKIDRGALPDAAFGAAVRDEIKPAALTAGAAVTLADVAAIWSDVLNVPSVSASDNFFDLGGHSLLAIEMHRRIKAELGVSALSIADIFLAPTLGRLHEVIARLSGETPEARSSRSETSPVAKGKTDRLAKRRALRAQRGR